MLRFGVDFNTMMQFTEDERVLISSQDEKSVVKEINLGERVIFEELYDFEVEGILQVGQSASGNDYWYGIPIWSTIRYWIEVDFNSMTKDGKRVAINLRVNSALLNIIQPNRKAVFYTTGEVSIDGYIEVEQDSTGQSWWYGVLDWSSRRDLSSQDNKSPIS